VYCPAGKNFNPMKTFVLLILFISQATFSISQNSFEFTISNDYFEIPKYSNEVSSGEFITLGARTNSETEPSKSIIISYTDIEDTTIRIISKPDTNLSFSNLIVKENGDYLLIGGLSPYNSDTAFLYLTETTPDFQIIWESYYQAPTPYVWFEILDYIVDNDNNIVLSGNVYYPNNGAYYTYLFMAKFNMQGEMLSLNIPEPFTRGGCSLLETPDSNGYYLIGWLAGDNSTAYDWIKFDKNLNITGSGLFNWQSVVGYCDAVFLGNGNLLVASTFFSEFRLVIFDSTFTYVKDTVFSGGGDYKPFHYTAIGYISDNLIWIGADYDDWPFSSGASDYYIYLYDLDLNCKGMKIYGGDTRYMMLHLLPTSDNGCIMTGAAREKEGSDSFDIYINKITLDEVYTSAEETPFEYDRDVSVYPNPFNNYINFETMRNNLRISLYDNSGKPITENKALTIPFSQLQTGNLKPGFYFYTINDNGRIIQSGKLIRK